MSDYINEIGYRGVVVPTEDFPPLNAAGLRMVAKNAYLACFANLMLGYMAGKALSGAGIVAVLVIVVLFFVGFYLSAYRDNHIALLASSIANLGYGFIGGFFMPGTGDLGAVFVGLAVVGCAGLLVLMMSLRGDRVPRFRLRSSFVFLAFASPPAAFMGIGANVDGSAVLGVITIGMVSAFMAAFMAANETYHAGRMEGRKKGVLFITAPFLRMYRFAMGEDGIKAHPHNGLMVNGQHPIMLAGSSVGEGIGVRFSTGMVFVAGLYIVGFNYLAGAF